MAKGTVSLEDWDMVLWRKLINAGTDGIRHNTIVHQMQTRADSKMLRQKLNAWHAEQKVQKFEVRTGGRNAILWRATEKLLDEYDTV